MAETVAAQPGPVSNLAATVANNSGNIAVGSVYLSNVVALIHWFFMCLSSHSLVEPDDLTKTLIGAMLTHLSAKISGWTSKRPAVVKAVDVAEMVASALEKAGVPAMVAKVAEGGSLSLGDKIGLGKALFDLTAKVDTILKQQTPSANPGAPPPSTSPQGKV